MTSTFTSTYAGYFELEVLVGYDKLGLDARKLVLGVSDEENLKRVCPATKTNYDTDTLLVLSGAILLSRKRTTKALTRLCGCAG